MGFLRELYAYMRARKTYRLALILVAMATAQRPARIVAGIGNPAVHIHPVLTRARPWYQCVLSLHSPRPQY